MCSSICFLSIVALLVTDMRTGALEENDIKPNECYNCHANNTTSCEQSSSWTSVTCPIKRPLCATIVSSPDFQSSLVCASAMKKPCTVKTASLNSSFTMTCVCVSHLCNAPFTEALRNELLGTMYNSTVIKQKDINELLLQFTNVTEDKIYKTITTNLIHQQTNKHSTVTKTANTSTQPVTSVPSPATENLHVILRDDKPKAEHLKQEPTVPSDDDEDEGEGSGNYDESKIHNRHASAPAAPSSYLPANENSASVLCKDLLIFILLIYLFV